MSEQRPRTSGSNASAGTARHGRVRHPHPWLAVLKFLGVAVVVVAISASSVVAIEGARQLNSIKTVDIPQDSEGPPPNIDAMEGGFNLLLVGSDTGLGQGYLGEGRGSAALNDVNILLHVSADHTNAVAVSFPRDMVMPIPSCTNPETGKKSYAMSGQPINVSLSYGGLGCAATVVENFTGVPVNFAGLITFQGVIEMSNAVGGVEVCLSEGIHDKWTGFNREAGRHSLAGGEALKFLRSRHGVGDGSDLTRISSQQVFLSSLVRTLKSNDTLGDFGKLYGIANAATQNMLLSSNLKSPDTMVAIARALKNIPLERVTFVQYPGSTGQPGIYSGKVKPNTALGSKLFDKIRADEPFLLAKAGDGVGSVLDPNATPLPGETASPDNSGIETLSGFRGQTAADQTCTAKLGR